MRRLIVVYHLLAHFVHSITRSKLISMLGFATVLLSAINPELFTGHPRVQALLLTIGSAAAALGKALLASSVPPQPDRVSSGHPFRSFALPLALLAPVLGLAFLTSACDKDKLHRAAVASDRLASLVKSGINLKRELRVENQIDDQGELELTRDLLDLNRAVTIFNNRARSFQTFDAHAQTELSALYGDVATAFNAFANTTTLHIKNPSAQAKLAPLLTSIRAAINLIGAVFGNGGKYVRTNEHSKAVLAAAASA